MQESPARRRRDRKQPSDLPSAIARHEYLFATMAYALILVLFLAPFFFQGKIFAAADYTLGSAPWRTHAPSGLTPMNSIRVDDGVSEYPRKVKFHEAVKQGGIPLWDSYKLGGYPFYEGVSQAKVLSPFFIWLMIIPPAVFTGLYAFAHLLLAGIATYLFSRTLKVTPQGAFLAGLVFMLSGPIVVWLSSVLAEMAFAYPLLLACVEGLVSTGSRRWLIAIPPVVGWMFLLGYPPGLVHLIAIVTVYAVLRLWQTRKVGARETWTRFSLLLGAAGLGLGIGAVGIHTMLTFLALSPHGSRIEAYQTLPSVSTLMFVYPNVYGKEAWSTWLPRYPHGVVAWGGPWNSCALTSYVGLLPLALAPFGAWSQRRSPAVRVIAIMAIVFGLIIWANPIPINTLLSAIPVVQAIVHTRLTIPLAMLLAVLAGIGVDALLVRPEGRRRALGPTAAVFALGIALFVLASYANQIVSKTVEVWSVAASVPTQVFQAAYRALQTREALIVPVLFVVMIVLLWLIARNRVSRQVGAGLLIAFALVDGLLFSFGFNPILDRSLVLPPNQSIEGLARLAKGYRVAPVGDWAPLGLGDIASAYKIESIGGYDMMSYSPLSGMLQSVEPTFYPGPSAAGSVLKRGAKLPSPVLDALSVKYLAADSAETSAVANLKQAGYRLLFAGDISVFENPRALPRAWDVRRVVGATDRQAQLSTVGDPAWNPRELAVADTDAAGSYAPARVKLREWKQGEVVLNVDTAGTAFVVLSEMAIPQWKAEIDGKPVEVFTTDYALLGAKVPKGRHIVRFWYESPGFWAWAWISAFFLGAWAVLSVMLLLPGKGRRGAGDTVTPQPRR